MFSDPQIFNIVSTDGTALKGRIWKPERDPLAVVILIHGMHSEPCANELFQDIMDWIKRVEKGLKR